MPKMAVQILVREQPVLMPERNDPIAQGVPRSTTRREGLRDMSTKHTLRVYWLAHRIHLDPAMNVGYCISNHDLQASSEFKLE